MQKKLILISGSPCVGKTAVGTKLFESYDTALIWTGTGAGACIHFLWRTNA